MGTLRAVVFVVLFLAGCSSAGDVPVAAGDAGTESPHAGVYPSEHVGGGPVCGWVPVPKPDGDGGVEWVEDYLPCAESPRDPASDPPMDDEHTGAGVPKGWAPPGPPGDPVPW